MEGETGIRDSLEIQSWGTGEKADCKDNVVIGIVRVFAENNIRKINWDQRFVWTAKILITLIIFSIFISSIH